MVSYTHAHTNAHTHAHTHVYAHVYTHMHLDELALLEDAEVLHHLGHDPRHGRLALFLKKGGVAQGCAIYPRLHAT